MHEFNDKIVGFAVKTRHGKFRPMVGRCFDSEGDDDCFVHVLCKNDPQDTLEAALALLDAEASKLHRVFRAAVLPSDMGFWVSVMIKQG